MGSINSLSDFISLKFNQEFTVQVGMLRVKAWEFYPEYPTHHLIKHRKTEDVLPNIGSQKQKPLKYIEIDREDLEIKPSSPRQTVPSLFTGSVMRSHDSQDQGR